MTGPRPDDLPPELLAGYADGELCGQDRARVERWLADHPEARELLEGQEALSPNNTEFWSAVRPPEPSVAKWAEVRDGVQANAPRPSRRGWIALIGAVGLMATAATLLFALPALYRPARVDPHSLPAPLPPAEDDEPFAMAGADDVRIVSLPESAAGLLVVGHHPLGDTDLVLARADEIEFHGVGSDLAGRFPEVPTDPAADDPPMIWAPREP